MNIVVAACGTSIINNACNQLGPYGACPNAQTLANRVVAAVEASGVGAGITNTMWAGVEAFAGQTVPQWGVSAEWDTIQALYQAGRLHDGENLLVLLASDTDPGIAAACITANILAAQVAFLDPFPPHGAQSPLPGSPNARFQRADIVRIEGLRPTDTSRLHNAAGKLASVLAWARSLADANGRVRVVLTGGYKSTIPILTLIISYMNPDGAGIDAWALHEDSDVAVQAPVRPLGPPEELCRVLTAGDGPVPAGYRGYYFNRRDDLTPLGRLVREVCQQLHGMAGPDA